MGITERIAGRRLKAAADLAAAAKRVEELIVGQNFVARYVAAAQQEKFSLRDYVIQKPPHVVAMHPGGDGFKCKLRVPMEVGIGHFVHRTLSRVDGDLPDRADNVVVGHLSAYAASRIVPDNPALLHADSWAYVLALPDIKKASPDPLRVERVEGIHVELGDTLTNRTWASGHADVDLHLAKAILLPGKFKKR